MEKKQTQNSQSQGSPAKSSPAKGAPAQSAPEQKSPQQDTLENRKRVSAIISSASGNLVEWYNFYAYSYAAIYFASHFFPSDGDEIAALLKVAGVFLVGFLMRPIGGWMFGRIADKYGRKSSMLTAILMMCTGSLLIAILPTYETVGVWAAVFLVLVRMLQGLSVGGGYGTIATYMSEVALKGRRGFFSSFQYVTLVGGQLLASFVVMILAMSMSEADLNAWGWRIPFFIGAAAAVIVFYLHASVHETSTAKTRANAGSVGLKDLLRNHGKAFMLVVGFTAGGSLTFYTYTTYMQKYLTTTTGFDKHTATAIITAALFIFMIIQPFFGHLADKIGTRIPLLIWSSLFVVLTIPALYLLSSTQSTWVAFFVIATMLCVASVYTSISAIIKAEMFPASVRALGVSLSYGIGNALFGGSAETIALYLKDIGHESTFYYYVTAMMIIAFLSVYFMPDARKSGYLQNEDRSH